MLTRRYRQSGQDIGRKGFMMQSPKLKSANDDQALFDPLSAAMASRDGDVLSMVRTALAGNQARLAFQPIVTAGPQGRIAFHEGLIRVFDDAGRTIPAAQFMPVVEEMDLGREVDCVTLHLVLRTLRENPNARLSVNLSARSLADGKWRKILYDGLNSAGALGDRLIFEISEKSAMLLPESVTRFMEEMQDFGVAFALDGFGAGFTSFSHLKDFYFDLVKVDKGFVRGIDKNPDNQVVAKALMAVAHQFEMLVIADGVETGKEAAAFTQLGADCLQGYFYGVPKFGF